MKALTTKQAILLDVKPIKYEDVNTYLDALQMMQPFQLFFVRLNWDASFYLQGYNYRIIRPIFSGRRVKLMTSNILLPVLIEMDHQIYLIQYIRGHHEVQN